MNSNTRKAFIFIGLLALAFTTTAFAEEQKEKTPVPQMTPSPTPAAVITSPPPKSAEASEKDFLIGPFVTAIALPRPLSGGLEAKLSDTVGISAGYGFLPELTISDVSAKIKGWDARLKWYPFKGSFFIGIGYGQQNLTGSQTQTISGTAVTGKVDQDNTFILPHVGWNWMHGTGFFMGIDLGVQVSLSHSTLFTSNADASVQSTQEYQNLQKDILDLADKVGKTPLPLLTLVKFGYMF